MVCACIKAGSWLAGGLVGMQLGDLEVRKTTPPLLCVHPATPSFILCTGGSAPGGLGSLQAAAGVGEGARVSAGQGEWSPVSAP